MARFEKILVRPEGKQVKLIVLSDFSFSAGKWFNEVFVRTRPNPGAEWSTIREPFSGGKKSLGGLSVAEYVERGRSGIMAHLRPAEIIKALMEAQAQLDSES